MVKTKDLKEKYQLQLIHQELLYLMIYYQDNGIKQLRENLGIYLIISNKILIQLSIFSQKNYNKNRNLTLKYLKNFNKNKIFKKMKNFNQDSKLSIFFFQEVLLVFLLAFTILNKILLDKNFLLHKPSIIYFIHKI